MPHAKLYWCIVPAQAIFWALSPLPSPEADHWGNLMTEPESSEISSLYESYFCKIVWHRYWKVGGSSFRHSWADHTLFEFQQEQPSCWVLPASYSLEL